MPDIANIRKYMETWNEYSYEQGLNFCIEAKQNERLFQLTEKILEILEIKDIPMNGFSIQHLTRKVDEGASGIVYSNIFYDSANKYITPVYYLAKMVEAYEKEAAYDEQEMAGKVARGLRAFPSFIREMDLEYKLGETLFNVESVRNPEQGIRDHTDILIRYDEQEYRVWSYQITPRGLNNTTERLLGKRGELPFGFHILCPIDVFNTAETEDISGWKLYADPYIQRVADALRQKKIEKYSEIMRKSQYAVKEYLKDIHILEKSG